MLMNEDKAKSKGTKIGLRRIVNFYNPKTENYTSQTFKDAHNATIDDDLHPDTFIPATNPYGWCAKCIEHIINPYNRGRSIKSISSDNERTKEEITGVLQHAAWDGILARYEHGVADKDMLFRVVQIYHANTTRAQRVYDWFNEYQLFRNLFEDMTRMRISRKDSLAILRKAYADRKFTPFMDSASGMDIESAKRHGAEMFGKERFNELYDAAFDPAKPFRGRKNTQ